MSVPGEHLTEAWQMTARRGQAALEFLTTYAWAFLVIMITLGALYYFGIFDFSKYIPEKCLFPSQFSCIDFSLQQDSISLKLANNAGESLSVTSVEITNDASPPVSCTAPSVPLSWASGTALDINFTSCSGGGLLPRERFDARARILYYAPATASHPTHQISGKISGRVLSP